MDLAMVPLMDTANIYETPDREVNTSAPASATGHLTSQEIEQKRYLAGNEIADTEARESDDFETEPVIPPKAD